MAIQFTFHVCGNAINLISKFSGRPELSWFYGDIRHAVDAIAWAWVCYRCIKFYLIDLNEFRKQKYDWFFATVGFFVSSVVIMGFYKTYIWLTHSNWKTVDVNKLIDDTLPMYGCIHMTATTLLFGLCLGAMLSYTTAKISDTYKK